MNFTIYQVDAFTDRLFGGNPAAVIPLSEWMPDDLMQRIAMENNLSETVFFVPSHTPEADFDIRWFTPVLEINLCGHATLASAFILFNKLDYKKTIIRFNSQSGILNVEKKENLIEMEFPAWKPKRIEDNYIPVISALGDIRYSHLYKSRDLLLELDDENAVRNCSPDFNALKKTGEKVIITARGTDVDFVSRFFAPVAGIDEDPVTGSAHSQLIPYWADKLGKTSLRARQLSQRGGELWCEHIGERVTMAGKCVFYMKGEIELN